MNDFEYFQFLSYRWDVTRAKAIADDLPVERIDPQPFFGWLAAVHVDADHLAHVDLGQPLILARVRELGGAAMLIDGWHRVARARRDGITELPCVVLDAAQERSVRIFGGTKQPGHGTSDQSFTAQEIGAVLLGEITDHFTECHEESQTYAGLDVAETRQERDAVVVRGYDRGSRRQFTGIATVRVTVAPLPPADTDPA